MKQIIMYQLYKRIITPVSLLLLFAQLHAQNNTTKDYITEIENWHTKRIESLKAANGWLNLVGLYWLAEGKNTFGSGNNNKIIFPQNTIPKEAGYYERKGNAVSLIVADTVSIKVNGKLIKQAVVFGSNDAKTPVITYENLQWTIIKRDDKIGIRLRNLKSPLLDSFKGIERYATNAFWKVTAKLQAPEQPKNIFITNVIGQTNAQVSPGKLIFTLQGKQYVLDALEEEGKLFIIFGDATSGKETYPAGRFLYASKPDAAGNTVIDFNKAYNPPCAFTAYATCPLPPKQNVLPIAITAGEKNYVNY